MSTKSFSVIISKEWTFFEAQHVFQISALSFPTSSEIDLASQGPLIPHKSRRSFGWRSCIGKSHEIKLVIILALTSLPSFLIISAASEASILMINVRKGIYKQFRPFSWLEIICPSFNSPFVDASYFIWRNSGLEICILSSFGIMFVLAWRGVQ